MKRGIGVALLVIAVGVLAQGTCSGSAEERTGASEGSQEERIEQLEKKQKCLEEKIKYPDRSPYMYYYC